MRFELFFDRTSMAMALIDSRGRIARVNSAFLQLLNQSEAEVTGYRMTDLLALCNHGEKEAPRQQGDPLGTTLINRDNPGQVLRVTHLPTPIHHNGELCVLVTLQEVSGDNLSQARMKYLCLYDPLTGLANVSLLMERLQHGIDTAVRTGKMLVLVLLNIRRFKYLNSTFGHDAGDGILRETAQRIHDAVRREDTVARHHGDTFAVLFEGITTSTAVELVLRKLFQVMEKPFYLGESEIFLSIGAGIAVFPDDGRDAGTLLSNAEAAMRQTAGSGTSAYRYFTAEMQHQARQQVQREHELYHAIERGEFEIFYQPILAPDTLKVRTVEALLRWNHPCEGRLSPREFIPLLEETGLIVKVGDWVLETACRQIQYWRGHGYPDLRLAVNISARQFQAHDFTTRLEEILAESDMPAEALDLEITESVLMEDCEESRQTLAAVSTMGCRLSIDDFGTGYSSLIYLKQLPVSAVKIDRCFIQGLPHGHHDISIAKAVIGLARNLGLSVTAEGVETREQLDFLGECDCQGVQGFYFAPPMGVSDFDAWHPAQGESH
jgi:diguanylate cyclase (GGDEF)-like protein/PAS domain S-box-containing protein